MKLLSTLMFVGTVLAGHVAFAKADCLASQQNDTIGRPAQTYTASAVRTQRPTTTTSDDSSGSGEE